jgi:hypothetical protein
MRKDGEPQVWGEGDLTIALGTDGFRVWVGTQLITYISSVKIQINPKTSTPEIELQFKQSLDQQEQLKIEQVSRITKTLSWIRVI